MAQINLDIPLISNSKGKVFVSYLNELQQNQLHVNICQCLFEAVDHEQLPPSVFSVFLPWSSCADAIVLCIRHGPSRSIRKQGIKQFGKALADPERWDSAWKAVGGVEGLTDLFAKISVREVEALSRAIGHCNHRQRKVRARENAIEELLRALVPSHYPGSKLKNPDERPIQDHYAQMVPACSQEFVEQLVNTGNPSNSLYQRAPIRPLIKTHGAFLRKHVMEVTFGDRNKDDHLQQYLEAFVYNQPPKPGSDPRVSASMDFAMRILQCRLEDIENDKRWPSKTSEAGILSSLLQRSLKRRLPEAKLHDVIILGLQLLEAKPKLKPEFESMDIWSKLITRWKKSPKLYDDSIALALRLKLGASQKTIGKDYLKTLHAKKVEPELRWSLLRLYCLHIPNIGVDLDTANDFLPLANQPWPCDIFYKLSKDQAIKLLKGLHNANPKYCFLEGPHGVSILSTQSIASHQNFNVVLLLTILQRESAEARGRAEHAIHELRQKAAAARVQAERAQLVKAVSDFAIASGSLDLYSETVAWQQRYIRDPLTLKIVFGRASVLTSEGIELLSGIPQPLPESITLNEIAPRVEKANVILMSFHDAKQIAEREPSFNEQDWIHVASLFGAAISERVIHAKDLQKRLRGQEADMYTTIWGGTLAMLQTVSVDFLKKASRPIESLIDTLPSLALAATTKAMLEAGNVKLRNKDHQSGDKVLERLSYKALIRLAKSEKPELAQSYVLQTILDRPDASSWHRQLLSVSFLKTLSAKDAHEMLLDFATAIGEKLEEQSYTQVSMVQPLPSGEVQPAISIDSKSLVKLTTVKYLAQILDNAEFISADAALEVLLELFKARVHIDIRLATLDSLLSLLNYRCSEVDKKWISNAVVEKIMGALDKVIPIAGSVNERHPPRLEDWEGARNTGILPLLSDIPDGYTSNISNGLPPLMNAIITAPDAPQYPGLKNVQAEFVARYLLPILWYSQVEHRKWVALFLAKYKANFTEDDLPPTPLTSLLWAVLLEKYPSLIPETVLDDFNKYIVMTMAPSTALKDFNKLFITDADLRSTPEVRHWLSVFGQSTIQYKSSATRKLVHMIHHSQPVPSVPNGITFGKVLDIVMSHASLFLAEYEKDTDLWNDFVNDLSPPTKEIYPREDIDSIRTMSSTWQKTGRLILERVVALVLDQKEKHALENKRSVLPSTTKLRLWLLPFPSYSHNAELRQESKSFVTELVKLLSKILKGEVNALRWPDIAKDAFTIAGLFNTVGERLTVALYVGEIHRTSGGARDPRPPAVNYVRVALAMHLIGTGKVGLEKAAKGALTEQGISLAQDLKKMVEEWQNDPDEGVRERVLEWRREHKELWKNLMSVE